MLPFRDTGLVSLLGKSRSAGRDLLVCPNDELAQELVAETVKVVTIELGRLLALEVGLCDGR